MRGISARELKEHYSGKPRYTWHELKSGLFVTVASKGGKTYIGQPVPKTFAVRMGMTSYEPHRGE